MTRGRDAQARAELAAAQARGEAQRAQELIDDFLVEARERGIGPVPLKLQTSRGEVKTGLAGWYLRRDRTIAVGTDGGYYVLAAAPVGPLAKLRGVRPVATPPPLVVGAGGRDGDAGPLRDYLRRVIDGASAP